MQFLVFVHSVKRLRKLRLTSIRLGAVLEAENADHACNKAAELIQLRDDDWLSAELGNEVDEAIEVLEDFVLATENRS